MDRDAHRVRPAIAALLLAIGLTVLGYRLFVDAVAAVLYNADERIPQATHRAWAYAALWGFGNAAIALWAYRAGLLRLENGVLRIVACGLLIMDASLLVVLGLRPGGDDAGFTSVFAIVAGLLVILGWRKRLLGGILIAAAGALFTVGGIFGSASYEGEATGLLYDEDMFFVLSFGLLPFACGLLLVLSRATSQSRNR